MRMLLAFLLSVLVSAEAFSQVHFTATLDGSQEVPPVVTTATGTGSFTLSDDFTRLSWAISYQGLTGTLTGGHFHARSAGANGPVVKAIASAGDPASNTISGTWTSTDASQPLTPALVDSLLLGRIYVNFHTAAHPGGEIRGQVNLKTGIHFTASLSGSQENPPVSSTGGGSGSFTLNPERTQLIWDITYRGLTSNATAGHFHVADSGRNGPVVRNVVSGGAPASNTVSGIWSSTDVTQPLTPALVDSLIAGKIYVNLHTSANPGGEMRGQLKRTGGTGFTARLSGAQENPPVTTSGSGTGSFSLNRDRTALSYDITYINLSGPLSAGGHFHAADSSRNGPVVRGIGSSGDSSSFTVRGVWRSSDGSPLTATLADSLMSGRIYVNFHTTANPGGEIRGQLQLTTGVGFTARLDGQQEVPPVITSGTGTASVVLNASRTAVRYDATYLNLSGPITAAHFHAAAPGVNGGVVKSISGAGPAAGTVGGDWTTSDVSQPLTRARADSMIHGRTYINFHTGTNPGGEIRGQVRLSGGLTTGVVFDPDDIATAFRLHQNYPNPFNPTTTIAFQVPARSRVRLSVFDLLGRELATLVDREAGPGSYTVQFDARTLTSGIYFYRLESDAGFVQTRKMMYLR